jgi:hypothetical protein
MDLKNISQSGHDLIKNKSSENEVLHAIEKLYHDGYDERGAQSNIYDIYLFLKKKNSEDEDIYIINYHWEDWFDGEEKGYTDESELIINKSSFLYRDLMKEYTETNK